jgi:hypothetical protein
MKQTYKILLYILITCAIITEIMLLYFCKLSTIDKIYIYSALIAQVLTIIGLITENTVLNDIGHFVYGLCTTLVLFSHNKYLILLMSLLLLIMFITRLCGCSCLFNWTDYSDLAPIASDIVLYVFFLLMCIGFIRFMYLNK